LFLLPDRSASTLNGKVIKYIPAGSLVCTDDWPSYHSMPSHYIHRDVNHSNGEYSRVEEVPSFGEVTITTNHIENLWHRHRHFLANKQLRTMDRVVSGNDIFMYWHTSRDVFDLLKVHS
jgi:IS1 family transposase